MKSSHPSAQAAWARSIEWRVPAHRRCAGDNTEHILIPSVFTFERCKGVFDHPDFTASRLSGGEGKVLSVGMEAQAIQTESFR